MKEYEKQICLQQIAETLTRPILSTQPPFNNNSDFSNKEIEQVLELMIEKAANYVALNESNSAQIELERKDLLEKAVQEVMLQKQAQQCGYSSNQVGNTNPLTNSMDLGLFDM